jgi:hypothetical protein
MPLPLPLAHALARIRAVPSAVVITPMSCFLARGITRCLSSSGSLAGAEIDVPGIETTPFAG